MSGSGGTNSTGGARRFSGPDLAAFGGARTVEHPHRERWKAIRPSDIARLVYHASRGRSTVFGAGLDVGTFEREFAAMTETRYAAAMNSGTAALHSAFVAVGVGPGDEVIVPSYTFFASAGPLLNCGATPVFCDIDEETLTADPDHVEQLIGDRTRAICVVHLWGNPARMDRLREIADRHGVALVEDASHAHGASFAGQPIGSIGDIGCFSLQGEKPVSGGEAGVAITNDPKLFDRMLQLGLYGRHRDLQAHEIDIADLTLGLKYRPHLYAMVLARGGLKRLPELNRRRRANYELLAKLLEPCAAVETIGVHPGAERGGMLEFILRYRPEHAGGWSREAFVNAVRAEGVPVTPDRYTPLHQQRLFSEPLPTSFGSHFGEGMKPHSIKPGELSVTETVCPNLMSMPPFTHVDERFIHECAAAFDKVAQAAPTVSDFRSGH